jgi:TonB family protein
MKYPDAAKRLGLGEVSALVSVTVDATGKATGASIVETSSNTAVDRAAVFAARQSQFLPALVNCQPVAGTYMLQVGATPPPF